MNCARKPTVRHWKTLLNSSKDVSDRQFVLRQFDKITNNDFAFESYFTPHNVKEAVKDLKNGKAIDKDALSSEPFIYAGYRINVL